MNIVLGISGGIAAYKTPELVRRLRERGADVQIVMTASAEEFVTPTSLQAVSGRPIRRNLWDKEAEASMSHIELARWADLVLIAPATAEIMARLASGAAPDLLTTLCLATEAPIVIAPAMNQAMWSNPATQSNVETLAARGVHILGPEEGELAEGEEGPGRMSEPEIIVLTAVRLLRRHGPFAERKVVVTAGPTLAPVDPVRFLGNRSSGRMGMALASAAWLRGADVVLIAGPTSVAPPHGPRLVRVETSEEMGQAMNRELEDASVLIMAAAVADFFVSEPSRTKIKRGERDTLDVQLNVLGDFDPVLPDDYKRSPFVFLANGSPVTQMSAP